MTEPDSPVVALVLSATDIVTQLVALNPKPSSPEGRLLIGMTLALARWHADRIGERGGVDLDLGAL